MLGADNEVGDSGARQAAKIKPQQQISSPKLKKKASAGAGNAKLIEAPQRAGRFSSLVKNSLVLC